MAIRPLYKAQEPFMEFKNGFGFQGVLMHDDVEDKVQCHLCGKWFDNLGQHIRHSHNETPDEYRMRVGLSLRTGLCSKRLSEAHRRVAAKMYKRRASGLIAASRKNRTRRSVKRARYHRQNPSSSMQFKNSRGLCDLQIAARYEIVKKIAGHIPTIGDLKRHDKKLCGVLMQRHGGRINDWRKKMGEKKLSPNEYRMFPDLDLVAILRKARTTLGHVPRPTDFSTKRPKGWPCFSVIYRRFGSWRAALRMAGIK